jgi:hypothetical protein
MRGAVSPINYFCPYFRDSVALDAGSSSKASPRRTAAPALQLLASTPFGGTEATMFVNGFTRKTLAPVIRNDTARSRLAVALSAASGSLRRVGGRSKVERRLANWCRQFCREWIARYFRLKAYYSCNGFLIDTVRMIRAGR